MHSEATTQEPQAAGQEAEQAQGWQSRLRLTHLWLAVPLLVTFSYLGISSIETFDFWWNAASGRIMTQAGQILRDDVLVYTPVRLPYYNPQWGAQLSLYWLLDMGAGVLLFVRCLIFTLVNGLVMYQAVRRSNTPRTAALVTLLAFLVSITNYGVRPQMLAFLPFALYYFILFGLPYKQHDEADLSPGPRIGWPIFALPLIMLYWVNVHGSFFIGGGLIAIYIVGTLWRTVPNAPGRAWLRSKEAIRQASAILLTIAAVFVNPYGFDIINYFFVATNDPIARTLNTEWQPPNVFDGGTGLFFYVSLAALIISIYVQRRRWNVYDFLIITVFGILALVSLRNVIWWGLIITPIITANFASRFAANRLTKAPAEQDTIGDTVERPALNWAALLLMLTLALLFNPLWKAGNPLLNDDLRKFYADDRPFYLAKYLTDRATAGTLNGRIFNYMEWGGYLEWKLYPYGQQMFIDGRFEARQVAVWQDYVRISKGYATWPDLLKKPEYGNIRFLVVRDTYQKDLIPLLNNDPNWKLVWPTADTPSDERDNKEATGYVYERTR